MNMYVQVGQILLTRICNMRIILLSISISLVSFLIKLPYLVDCVWGNFGDWGECSVTCGDGIKTRTRNISMPAIGTGANCTDNATEDGTCNDGECPGW